MQLFIVIKTKLNTIFLQQSYKDKKFILFWLIISIFLFYFLWTRREPQDKWRVEHQKTSFLLTECLEKYETISQKSTLYDVFFKKLSNNHNDQSFLPYIGNGYVSVLADEKSNLYLKEGRTVGLKVPYKPFFSITLKSQHTKASSLNIRNGTVHNYHCYKSGDQHFSLEVMYYAHRTIPSLLVQQVASNHPSYPPLNVLNNNHDFSNQSNTEIQLPGDNKKVKVSVIKRVVSDQSAKYLVLVLQSNSSYDDQQRSLERMGFYLIGGKANENHLTLHTYLTYVTYQALSPGEDLSAAAKRLTDESLRKFKGILHTNCTDLNRQHITAWNNLWRSGFSISRSLAQNSINGDRINKTFYYLLSSVRHYLVEKRDFNKSLTSPLYHSFSGLTPVAEARKSLYSTDRCYSGHHTLQSDKLWADITSMEKMINSVTIWIITLEKNGCGQMLNAGAEGLMQSMMLSLGGLRFGDRHLEMAIHPSDLHRDLQFRRINYDANTHLSISVRVGGDNRAVIYVSLDRSNTSFYACDAGCMDQPVRLSNFEVSLPVKLTLPVTSILYIAPDIQHVNELKHAIHVQSIDHAPAHEHDLLALHRHGHRWGGLPVMFWVVLGALIIIFHLFLFKLVYNEYCSNQEKGGYIRHHKFSGSSINYAEQRSSMFGHQRRFV